MKNIKINLNNWGNGTLVNDLDIEKVIEGKQLNFSKEVSFQEDEVFGTLKFFDIDIEFSELDNSELDVLIQNLIDVGANGSVKCKDRQSFLNEWFD